MISKSRGHCDNIKVFNQGKSNQIREKSGNLIAKNVWPPCNSAEPFKQIVNILSKGPMLNLVKIAQVVSEKKIFKDSMIFYMYSPGARANNPQETKF